jgi:threonine dehydrogenase-like Zn-dependent dehydrogenase
VMQDARVTLIGEESDPNRSCYTAAAPSRRCCVSEQRTPRGGRREVATTFVGRECFQLEPRGRKARARPSDETRSDLLAVDGRQIGDGPLQVLEQTKGEGAARGVEAVGWQAHDPQGHEVPNSTINDLIASVRATAGIGVLGVWVPEDPESPDEQMQEGKITVDFGLFFQKGLKLGCGQANVKSYNRELRDLIHAGKAKPSWIVSHHLSLDEAPEAYEKFDAREDGWTKVILHPDGH